MIKKKLLNKSITLLTLSLMLFHSVGVPLAYAMEGEGPVEEQSPNSPESGSTELSSGDPEPDSFPSDSEESDEGTIHVENENEADVENELAAEAETGNEEIVGNAGEVDVSSDDAEAVVDLTSEVNDNTTEIEIECASDCDCPCEPPADGCDSCCDPCDSDSEEFDLEFDIIVESTSSAQVANDLTADALSGDNEVILNAGDAEVTSGDAVAAALLENEVNTNETELTEVVPCEGCEVEGGADVDVLVENENLADATNNVDLEATSGANLVQLNAGDATITSGDAIALANLLNFINTNLTGSNFLYEIIDSIGDLVEDIDLLGSFLDLLSSEEPASSAGEPDEGSLTVNNVNEGSLVNNVELDAFSGGNDVLSNAGDATIESGEASALANVINFLNTNLTGSNWLFNITNIFGDFIGDIVLPGEGTGLASPSHSEGVLTTEESQGDPSVAAADLRMTGVDDGLRMTEVDGGAQGDDCVGSSICGPTELNVENENLATVETDIETDASTGGNLVEQNAGDVLIENGDTVADSNLVEKINTNYTGESWVFIIINKVGEWIGSIIDGPEEDESSSDMHLIYDYSLGDDCGECCTGGCDGVFNPPVMDVSNDNVATLENNIDVAAATGENNVIGNAGDASIASGAAAALANVINFVNTNFVGSNWLFSIVNIFGDWEGDLVFAYPDLAIAETDYREMAEPGETLTYEISYENQGQLPAQDVYVFDTLPSQVSYVSDTSGVIPSVSGQTYTWFIGDLAAGASGTFSVTVVIDPALGLGTHHLDSAAAIETCSQESNSGNNFGGDRTVVAVYPDLVVAKDDGLGSAEPGDELTYTITYSNEGNFTAQGVDITDYLPDYTSFVSASGGGSYGSGAVGFSLGDLAPGEGGSVTVTVRIDETLPFGVIDLANEVVIATSTEEVSLVNNQATDFTQTNAYADVTVSKTDNEEKAQPKDELTYTITYKNQGTIPAEDVLIEDELPDYVEVREISDGGYQDGDYVYWELGTVAAGFSGEVHLKVEIGDEFPEAEVELENKVFISTTTTEEDYGNNDDEDETDVEAPPELWISKKHELSGSARVGDQIEFKIVVANTGYSPVYEVDLDDILRNEVGEDVHPQYWDLGAIAVGEEVKVEYTLEITEAVEEGHYTNTAQAIGEDSGGGEVKSDEEKTSFEVGEGDVLGAGTGAVLAAFLPESGDGTWVLVLAGVCLILAGFLLHYSFKSRRKVDRSSTLRARPLVEPRVTCNVFGLSHRHTA